jgi:hypothetical protein
MRIAADHRSDVGTGCCMGQAGMVAEGLGLPHRVLVPATTALTGFQVVMACSQPGMCCVGTMAFETMVRGKSTMNPNEAAASGLFELSPTQAAIHETE